MDAICKVSASLMFASDVRFRRTLALDPNIGLPLRIQESYSYNRWSVARLLVLNDRIIIMHHIYGVARKEKNIRVARKEDRQDVQFRRGVNVLRLLTSVQWQKRKGNSKPFVWHAQRCEVAW